MSQDCSDGLYIAMFSIHGLIRGENLELGRDADTGGQTQYVVELTRALAGRPEVARVDLITRQMAFSRADFAALPDTNPAMRLFKGQAEGWIDRVESMGWEKDGCALHDAAAAAYLLRPEFFETQKAKVEVTVEGSGKLPAGATVLKLVSEDEGQEVEVVTRVDAQACRELIWSFMQ